MAGKKKNSNYVTEKSAQKKEAAAKKKQSDKKKAQIKSIALWCTVALLVIGAIVAGMYFGGAFDYIPEGTMDVLISFAGETGSLHAELYGNDAPGMVAYFTGLVGSGYFNNKTVNGYKDGNLYLGAEASASADNLSTSAAGNKIPFSVGSLVMAIEDNYDSSYGRFFIVTEDTDVSSLKGRYAVFGKVTDGMDVVEKIISNIHPDAEGKIPVAEQVRITSITAHESHSH